jgi:hypothetical protein
VKIARRHRMLRGGFSRSAPDNARSKSRSGDAVLFSQDTVIDSHDEIASTPSPAARAR